MRSLERKPVFVQYVVDYIVDDVKHTSSPVWAPEYDWDSAVETARDRLIRAGFVAPLMLSARRVR